MHSHPTSYPYYHDKDKKLLGPGSVNKLDFFCKSNSYDSKKYLAIYIEQDKNSLLVAFFLQY
jgi:hypothetical protein